MADQHQFVFPREEYERLCQLAKSGELEEIKTILERASADKVLSPLSLCPPASSHQPTPLVLAAQYGQHEVVQYLLHQYGNTDQLATIISRTTKKNVHHATALWAACTGGHLEIVKLLVKHGADVNRTTLTRSTPLRGASFHGYIPVMAFLLEAGANINTPNCIGQSPLCIAAMRGEVEAVRYLLDRKADVTQTTINGYTVMHLAAAKGKVEVVELLLANGVSAMFSPAEPYREGYIPCPLFLAASTGNEDTVRLFISQDDCPASCKADSFLLLAAMKCELKVRLRPAVNTDILNEWKKGLAIKQAHKIETVTVPARPEYCNMTEITTVEQLESEWHTFQFAQFDAFFQALLIRERCMGFYDQGLIYFLLRRGSYFNRYGRYEAAERLWSQSMKMEVEVCEAEIKHTEYGHCEGILRDLEKDLSVYADGVWRMLDDEEHNHRPMFAQYIRYGLQELDILSRLDSKADTEIVSNELILGIMLFLFLLWLTCDPDCCHEDHIETDSKECTLLGREFVNGYLHHPVGSSLLHLSLTNFRISDESTRRHVFDRSSSVRPLVDALLSWGADDLIDSLDSDGNRPIHLAMSLSNNDPSLVSCLLDYGVHLDAVNSYGQSVYDLHSTSEPLHSAGAPPLACLAARCVVYHNISYQHKLPSHVINMVRLHHV